MAKTKVARNSKNFWELDGESELHAATVPDPPEAATATTVRVTLSNPYGPVDDVEVFVRVGNPDKPTAQGDLDSAKDWFEAPLVEELVNVDGEEMVRSREMEPFEDETPWEGTYEAHLVLPPGRRSIEIKVLSHNSELLRSVVLSDWDIAGR
jgi:hypothetical protein